MSINRFTVLALPVAALALAGFAHHPGGGGARLEAALADENEVPPIDGNASGMIKLTLNPGQGEVCYSLMIMNIDDAVAAHIHSAEAGVNGPVVVDLDTQAFDSMIEKCVEGSRGTITAILRDPSAYYVNVHTTSVASGEVRGQLQRSKRK